MLLRGIGAVVVVVVVAMQGVGNSIAYPILSEWSWACGRMLLLPETADVVIEVCGLA